MKISRHLSRFLFLAATLAAAGCLDAGTGDESLHQDAHTPTDGTSESWSYPEVVQDYTGADSAADAPYDSVFPDVVSDVVPDVVFDVVPDVEEEAVEPNVCDLPVEEPQILYLSADDSNSQASPVVARWMIMSGDHVPWHVVRTYEFLNYYMLEYEPPAHGRVSVTAQMAPDPDDDALFDLQIGVQGHLLEQADRRPLNLTFSLDTSGSMRGGPIERLKAVCRAIAGRLRAGEDGALDCRLPPGDWRVWLRPRAECPRPRWAISEIRGSLPSVQSAESVESRIMVSAFRTQV